ncbi:MAG: hydroxyethylthiazole kinase [Lachnospiraceae bacterium]|nr:hydroxyethylthiazole kinase [Lachnospiraceae bacterium]
MQVKEIREKLKEMNPLIHCITNPISIRECANVILSAGARPMMAVHPAEVQTVTKSAGALLINLGNLTEEREKAILLSADAAGRNNIPCVLDLCGAAGLKNRRELALSVIKKAAPGIIKGNYAEIKALYDETYKNPGVDTDECIGIEEISEAAKTLAQRYKTTILASGKTDVITDGNTLYHCENGTPQLAKITGTGCMQGALSAAFLSAAEALDAALFSCVMYAVCGEKAETPLGSGSFEVRLMDALSVIESEEIERKAKLKKVM